MVLEFDVSLTNLAAKDLKIACSLSNSLSVFSVKIKGIFGRNYFGRIASS